MQESNWTKVDIDLTPIQKVRIYKKDLLALFEYVWPNGKLQTRLFLRDVLTDDKLKEIGMTKEHFVKTKKFNPTESKNLKRVLLPELFK